MALDLKANLGKFLPFMDFVLNMNFIEQPKVLQQWKIIKANIEQNKTFQNQKTLIDVFSKVIRSRYYELMAKSLTIPKEFTKVLAIDMPIEASITIYSSDEETEVLDDSVSGRIVKEEQLEHLYNRQEKRDCLMPTAFYDLTETTTEQPTSAANIQTSYSSFETFASTAYASTVQPGMRINRDPRLHRNVGSHNGMPATVQQEMPIILDNLQEQQQWNMQQAQQNCGIEPQTPQPMQMSVHSNSRWSPMQMPVQSNSRWSPMQQQQQQQQTQPPWSPMQQQQQQQQTQPPWLPMQQQQQQHTQPPWSPMQQQQQQVTPCPSMQSQQPDLSPNQPREYSTVASTSTAAYTHGHVNYSQHKSERAKTPSSLQTTSKQSFNARSELTHASNNYTPNSAPQHLVTSLTNKQDLTPSQKTLNTHSSFTMEKELRNLDCTVNGFNKLSNYSTVVSQRQSSIYAKHLITQQLRDDQEDRALQEEVRNLDCNKLPDYSTVGSQRQSSIYAKQLITQQLRDDPDDHELQEEVSNLDCTVNGFQDIPDYSMIGTQRRSSLSARQRIAELLRDEETNNDYNCSSRNDLPAETFVPSTKNSSTWYIEQPQPNHVTKPCSVKLKRLVMPKKPANDQQKNVQKKQKSPKNDTHKTSIVARTIQFISNTHNRMMEHIQKKCVLCVSKPGNLVWHFVNKHKTESYVSRLGKIKLNYLEHNIPFATIAPNGKDCSVECYFCKKLQNGRFHQLHEHFSEHTGEFAYKCKGCGHQEPNIKKMRKHFAMTKTCHEQNFKVQYAYSKKLTVIQLHCCAECNFLQLNQVNIWNHLEKHHGILAPQSYPELIKSYTIAALQDQIYQDYDNYSDISTDELQHNNNVDDDVNIQNEPIQPEDGYTDLNNPLHYDNADVEHIFEQFVDNTVATNTACENSIPGFNFTSILPAQNIEKPRHGPITIDVKPNLQALNKCMEVTATIKKGFKHYPKNVQHYFGFYKCGAEDCYFSTDVENDLLQHLVAHSECENPTRNYLECVYCNRNVTTNQSNLPQDLVVHIRLQHPFTRYQCLCCTYRSNDPLNVVSHSRHSHAIHQNMVYDCLNPKHSPQQANNDADDLAKVKASMLQHVQPFACKVNDCKATFYALSSWEMHLKQKHPLNSAAALSKVNKWCCPYCKQEAATEKYMRTHLTYKHPAMPIYVVMRQLVVGATIDAAANMLIMSLTAPVSAERIIKVHQNAIEAASSANKQLEKDLEEKELKELQEKIKDLLLKLTYKTGVSPDALYRCCSKTCLGYFSTFTNLKKHIELRGHQTTSCWLQCPHCPDNDDNKYSMEVFEAHLCSHSRHLFVCLECGKSFGAEQKLRLHSQQHQAQVATMRLRKLSYNVCYSYHLLCDAKLPSKNLEFLKACRALLTKHIKQQEKMEAALLKRKWRVDENCAWLDNFPKYVAKIEKSIKCGICSLECDNNKALLMHALKTHSKYNKCVLSRCSHILLPDKHLIEKHTDAHMSENLFICCVCSMYNSHKSRIVKHIRQEHELRDVPMLQLHRSKNEMKFSLAILFARHNESFSKTLNNCFACDRRNMTVAQFENHLIRSHMMTMERYCQLCDQKLKPQSRHFEKNHANKSLKIRVEFKNPHNIVIDKLHPLGIHIEGLAVKACKRTLPRENNVADDVECSGKKPRTIDEEVLQTKEERQLAIVDATEMAASDGSDAEDDDMARINEKILKKVTAELTATKTNKPDFNSNYRVM